MGELLFPAPLIVIALWFMKAIYFWIFLFFRIAGPRMSDINYSSTHQHPFLRSPTIPLGIFLRESLRENLELFQLLHKNFTFPI